jgi:gamma-glutamylcyclotransferase (GGCT)/AIG2-like uncharacterized protein YtfP
MTMRMRMGEKRSAITYEDAQPLVDLGRRYIEKVREPRVLTPEDEELLGRYMTKVFIYGTLAPGQHRWTTLEPYCDNHTADAINGELYDTGYGWPAAVITTFSYPHIPGYTVTLKPETVDIVLPILDDIEGHPYLFERIPTQTINGVAAWVYHWTHSTAGYQRIERWIT